jgi:hypothetical protein
MDGLDSCGAVVLIHYAIPQKESRINVALKHLHVAPVCGG